MESPTSIIIGTSVIQFVHNYLELWVNGAVAKFANDIQIFRMVNSKEDCKELQEDVSKCN